MDFKMFSELILIEQTLFTLPFAYLGLLFAGGGTFKNWLLVTIALLAARTSGMSFNRVIDVNIDKENPRTKERVLPRGDAKPLTVWLIAIISALVLIAASYMLNRFCFYLSFFAVFLLFTYSYLKRFSSSSHFYLGFVEAAAPVGGYLAVTGAFAFTPFLLGFVIMAWIAGLDIIYAIQDREFDEKAGLHSMPVKVGIKNAINLSGICYACSFAGMLFAGFTGNMKWPYWIAILPVGVIFVYHQILGRSGRLGERYSRLFKSNMLISPLLLAGTWASILI
ncbi:MAG: 4-hydroxybenzoate octaprenyltransferase [Deltaproteobacteria bacterium]|nr:4-hydroxybenzoate octaprenyltransferase [Deltaproteobacteria bacterium]